MSYQHNCAIPKDILTKVTFVLPFYKKLDLFRSALLVNRQFFTNPRIEVVVAMDDPEGEQEVVELCKPLNAIVVVNDVKHDWRPPCKAINVGIRHATGEYVVIASPECMLDFTVPLLLNRIEDVEVRCDNFFIVGHVRNHDDQNGTPGYGFILAKRLHFELIHGFDERRKTYGGDDDDIRHRFKYAGFEMIYDRGLMVVHQNHERERGPRIFFEPYGRDLIIPCLAWGQDFNRVAYSYRPL